MEPQTSGSFATRSDVNLPGDCSLTSSCIFIIYEHCDKSSHGANCAYFEKVKVETGENDGVEKIKIPEPVSAGSSANRWLKQIFIFSWGLTGREKWKNICFLSSHP